MVGAAASFGGKGFGDWVWELGFRGLGVGVLDFGCFGFPSRGLGGWEGDGLALSPRHGLELGRQLRGSLLALLQHLFRV